MVAPFGRRLRPDDFRTAGDRVRAVARLVTALPAEALILDRAALRRRADERRIARAMGLAEGVAAGDQRDGFLVVHRHAHEGFADVLRRRDRVRLAVRPLGIDVNQAHLHGAERMLELALAAVALVAEPGSLGTPVKLLRLPHVLASAGEAEGLEAHQFKGDVACENHEIGPGNLLPVFLLDRPQQATRLVEIGVVRPAVEGREALLSRAGAAAPVGDAIGARAVPRHADEQAAVMAEVSRPPVLRIRHQRMQILDDGVEVEAPEFLRIVEIPVQRVGQGRNSREVCRRPGGPATSRDLCAGASRRRHRPRPGICFRPPCFPPMLFSVSPSKIRIDGGRP